MFSVISENIAVKITDSEFLYIIKTKIDISSLETDTYLLKIQEIFNNCNVSPNIIVYNDENDTKFIDDYVKTFLIAKNNITKIITSGNSPLIYIDKDLPTAYEISKSSGLSNLEYHINNRTVLVYVSVSAISSIYTGKIAQLESSLRNIITSTNASLKNTLENVQYIPAKDFDKYTGYLTSVIDKDGFVGFDIETNGLAYNKFLRLTGIGFSGLNDHIFFYFSVDRDEYAEEFKKIKESLTNFLVNNYSKLVTYNSKFESNVFYRLLGIELEFQDALPVCLMHQSPNGLKKNASAHLGVPIWNDEVSDFVDTYEKLRTIVIENKNDSELIDLKNGKFSDILFKRHTTLNEEYTYVVLNFSDTEPSQYIVNDNTGTYFNYKTSPRARKLFRVEVKDGEILIASFMKHIQEEMKDYKIILEDVEDEGNRLLIKFKAIKTRTIHYLQELINDETFYSKKLYQYLADTSISGWELVPRKLLGKYCVYDCYYTLHLFLRLLTPEYKKSYHIYRSQTFISGIMERYGLTVNPNMLNYCYKAYNKDLLDSYKFIINHPQVTQNIIDKVYDKRVDEFLIEQGVINFIKNHFVISCDDHVLKRISQMIVTKTVDEDVYHDFYKIVANINPQFFDDPTMFRNNIIVIINNLYQQSIVYNRMDLPDKTFIKNEVTNKINSATSIDDFKEFYNPMSTSEGAGFILWSVIVDETYRTLIPYYMIYKQLDYFEMVINKYGKYIVAYPDYLEPFSEMKNAVYECRNSVLNRVDKVVEFTNKALEGQFDFKIIYTSNDTDNYITLSNSRLIANTLNEGKSTVENIIKNGRNFDDFHTVWGTYLTFMTDNTTSLEDYSAYPINIKLLFSWLKVKKITKAIGTYLLGATGSANLQYVDLKDNSRDDYVDIDNIDVTRNMVVNSNFLANFKETLRWGSGVHTIPKLMEANVVYSTRSSDNIQVSFDAAQSEVRVIATVADDKNMLESFKRGEDIHRANAARLFKIKPEEVTKLQRDAAKSSVTFGLLYGKSIESLAKDNFNGDIEYASAVNEALYREMPDIKKWMDKKHREVVEKSGKVTIDLFDHDLFVGMPSEHGKEHLRRAVNYPIQSLSSSLNGYLGYLLYLEAYNQGITSLPLSFVHDAWKFELPISQLFKFLDMTTYYFKELPYKSIGLPADCDFDIGINGYLPNSFTYQKLDGKIIFETKINMIHGNEDILKRFERLLPDFKLLESQSSKKILTKSTDLSNNKVSWGRYNGVEIDVLSIKCECRDNTIDMKPYLFTDIMRDEIATNPLQFVRYNKEISDYYIEKLIAINSL